MSRLPVHLERTGPRHDRQAVWETLRRLREATAPELRSALHGVIATDRVHTYLKALAAAGYVERTGTRPLTRGGPPSPVYRLARDVGVEAPRVRDDGTAVTQGRHTEMLWTVLRILREPLSPEALAAHASTPDEPVSPLHARDYLRRLHQAGYLRKSAAGYALLPWRNTGPRPPMVQRVRQLYDPNLERVVWSGEARHE